MVARLARVVVNWGVDSSRVAARATVSAGKLWWVLTHQSQSALEEAEQGPIELEEAEQVGDP